MNVAGKKSADFERMLQKKERIKSTTQVRCNSVPTNTISNEVETLFKELSGLSDNLAHLRDKLSPFLKDAEPTPMVESQISTAAPTNNSNIMNKLLEMGVFVSDMQRRVIDMTNRVQD